MEISVNLPLDEGFLRRECPRCEREFKWHHGPTEAKPDEQPDPNVYWCPYCGETSLPDQWWTPAQLAYVQAAMAGPAMEVLADELGGAFKGSGSGSGIEISMSVEYDDPEPPDALHEPADMIVVEPPCHPWEPLKVDDEWRAPLHCLLCGQQFALT